MSKAFDDSEFRKLTAKLSKVPSDIMKEVHKVFVDNTPENTGYAKKHTKVKDKTVEADYPYAFVLDGGRKRVGNKMQGSTQAPKGMTEPTIKEMEKIVETKIKKVGG